jgi:hypothetical protein
MTELPIMLQTGETIVYEAEGVRVTWDRGNQMRAWVEDHGLKAWISYDFMTSYNILGFEDAEKMATWWVDTQNEEEQRDAE